MTAAGPLDDPARSPVAWARQQLPGATVVPVRSRPWAQLWSVDSPAGRWWLKVSGAAHEPRLLGLLAEVGTPLVPDARVHPERPWALVRDAGRAVRELGGPDTVRAVLDFWCGLLPRYAELQQTVAPEQALAAGVPDASPAALPGVLATLLAEPGWLAPAHAPGLTEEDRDRIRRCGGALRAAVAAQVDGPDAALQHDDLHGGNVFVPAGALDPARAAVIDWGDASVSHPFTTLLVTERSLAATLGLEAGDAGLGRVRDAYLEAWRTGGESRAELHRQLELALRTAPLVRAASWRRALGTPEAGTPLAMADGTATWLLRLAERLAVG